jgi:hypothetical protein
MYSLESGEIRGFKEADKSWCRMADRLSKSLNDLIPDLARD